MPDDAQVLADTRRWIESMVIGLGLCPFARRVFENDTIRYVVTGARTAADLLAVVTTELETLSRAPITEIETTIVIHPSVLGDFLDYNDFLSVVDWRLSKRGLTGVIQVASFHPKYRFEGTDEESPENYTNRSPYPMLHLLREESITRLAATPAELEEIPRRNIALLKSMGLDRIRELIDRG